MDQHSLRFTDADQVVRFPVGSGKGFAKSIQLVAVVDAHEGPSDSRNQVPDKANLAGVFVLFGVLLVHVLLQGFVEFITCKNPVSLGANGGWEEVFDGFEPLHVEVHAGAHGLVDFEVSLQSVRLDGLRHRGATDVLDVLNGSAVEVGGVGKGSDSVVEVKVQNLVHPVTLYSKSVKAKFQMDVMVVKSTSKGADFFKDDLMCLKSGNGKDEKQAK